MRMNRLLHKVRPSAPLAAFLIASLGTFVCGYFTMLDQPGPGVASAWAAAALQAGQPADAGGAKLFLLLMRAVGMLGAPETAHIRAGLATLLGWALFAGSLAGMLTELFGRWKVWSALTAGTVAGILAASAKLIWATALAPNPAPFALAAIAGGFWAVILPGVDDQENRRRAILAIFLSFLAFHFGKTTLLFFPIILILAAVRYQPPYKIGLLEIAVVLLPSLLFFVPETQPTLAVSGYLSAAKGIPEGVAGFPLLGWSVLHTIGVIPLLPALYGLYALARRSGSALWLIAALMLSILTGTWIGGDWSLFAGLASSAGIVTLAMIGVVELFTRLTPGFILSIWVLPLLLWFSQAESVSRQGERIWNDHQNNVIRTARYGSLILSTDEATINTLRAYDAGTGRVRPDLRLVNPYRLTEITYLEYLNNSYRNHFQAHTALFDSLLTYAQQGEQPATLRPLARRFLSQWVESEVERSGSSGGVLVSPGYDPGTSHELVPEGLLVRIWKGDTAFPFIFRNLRLAEIRFAPGQTRLEQGIVAQYPMMFTERGAWMIDRRYYSEGMDYVRHAMRIDPWYEPARILADRYAISGDPIDVKEVQK